MYADKLKLFLTGALIGFVLANLLLLYYESSPESYLNEKIKWWNIVFNGYTTHFTFIIAMTIMVPVVTLFFNVPAPINGLFILVPIWLDKLVIKKFQLNRKVYSENE